MHQHEGNAKKYPGKSSGSSDSKQGRDGEYGEVERGEHGVPPEMQTSQWQLPGQFQGVENKGLISLQ